MPLTGFQRTVLRLLAEHRSPESFVAGGSAINVAPDSPRYSDIFHDAEESVIIAATTDTKALTQSGFTIEWTIQRPGFQRATIGRDGESLRLEWTQDSAFRFFPVQSDPEFGWRLHLADLATNKVLALAGRWEVRDFVDTLYFDGSYASLGILARAAVGKDRGLTPSLILEQADRFNRLRSEDFRTVLSTDKFDFVAMKTSWRESVEAARKLVAALPSHELGALYLDANGRPANPLTVAGARPHYASLGGVWPHLAGDPAPLPDAERARAEEQVRQRYQRD